MLNITSLMNLFYIPIAPQDCLQYYTSASGVIRSFNWKDIAGTATRQLANQDYKICFRSELLESRQVLYPFQSQSFNEILMMSLFIH